MKTGFFRVESVLLPRFKYDSVNIILNGTKAQSNGNCKESIHLKIYRLESKLKALKIKIKSTGSCHHRQYGIRISDGIKRLVLMEDPSFWTTLPCLKTVSSYLYEILKIKKILNRLNTKLKLSKTFKASNPKSICLSHFPSKQLPFCRFNVLCSWLG